MSKAAYFYSSNAGDLDHLVRQSTRLGVDWPENVSKLIEKRKALLAAYRDVEPVAPEQWTLKTLETVVGDLALDHAAAAYRRDALATLAVPLDRELRRALLDAWPTVHAGMAEKFAQHAKTYTEAAVQVPLDLDEADLMRAPSDVLSAYSTARVEAGVLNTIVQAMRAVEAGLHVSDGGSAPRSFDYCAPESVKQAERIDIGRVGDRKLSDNSALNLLGVSFLAAVHEGVSLRLHRNTERRDLFEALSDPAPVRPRKKAVSNGR